MPHELVGRRRPPLGENVFDDRYLDVDNDGFVSPLDALLVINQLGPDNAARFSTQTRQTVDVVFAGTDEDDEDPGRSTSLAELWLHDTLD